MNQSALPASVDTVRQSLEKLQARLSKTDTLQPLLQQTLSQLQTLGDDLARADEQSRLLTLYRVSQALGSSLHLDDALAQVMDSVIELTGAERGFVMLIDQVGGTLNLRAARNLDRANLGQKDMEYSRTVVESVARTGMPVLTTNAQTDPRFSKQRSVKRYALRSILCVPLQVKERVLGVIYVDNRVRAGLFTSRDLELLTTLASQSATVIENARLYTLTDQELASRLEELQRLQQVDRQLNATLDVERVAETFLDWAMQGTRAEQGWVAVRLEEGRGLQIAAARGWQGEEGPSFPADGDPLAEGLEDGKVVMRPAGVKTSAALLGPVLREGSILGAVMVSRQMPSFTPKETESLTRLVDHAATALENTRLFQAVRRADEAKSQFVSIVSHELKVPMTSIRGYADLLRKGSAGPVSEKQIEYLDTVLKNVDRMAALVSDLQDLSSIESGRLRIEPVPIPLGRCLQESLESMSPHFSARQQEIETEIPPDLPAVRADRNRLMQILTNLLSNANKYTPQGGSIFVNAQRDGDRVRVLIRDTGIGMTPEEKLRLFNQFFRGESSAVRDQPGWGLGLHVTKRLVELQGGRIGAESELGKGSTFWFTLPAVAEHRE
ncbi:MAG: ATP-binding protein [Anaerolineales bacterium]|jgi:signal transduction histidine kinase